MPDLPSVRRPSAGRLLFQLLTARVRRHDPCVLLLYGLVLCVPSPAPVLAASPPEAAGAVEQAGGTELDPEVESRLAERFAPTLVFHPLEQHFPTSPLFPLETPDTQARRASGESPASLLGTAISRRARYEALTLDEKGRQATVYYRAYPARYAGEDVLVIEYWFYYVQNAYRVRGNLYPFWADASHPNDLEHLHLILRQTDGAGLVPIEVLASAHEGTIPANRYRYPPGTEQERGRFLVERGAHALAPDVNGDGMFTPGVDGDSGYKIVWGIRDRGVTWSRFRPSYMDARDPATAIVFEPATEGQDPDLSYRLVPVRELVEAFAALHLSASERRALFEVRRHWFPRVFGADNGTSRKLLVPPPRDPRSTSIGIDSFLSTERGLLIGGVFNHREQGALVGARYGFLHDRLYLPDVLFEVDGLFGRKQQRFTAQALASYPLGGSVKVMAGRAVIVDATDLDRRQHDWIVAVEIRFGRVRFFSGHYPVGSLTPYPAEFRLSYFF